jgi:hypothetical protein
MLILDTPHFSDISQITKELLRIPGVVAVGPLLPEPSGRLAIPIRSEGLSLAGTEFEGVLKQFKIFWGSIHSLGPSSLGLP